MTSPDTNSNPPIPPSETATPRTDAALQDWMCQTPRAVVIFAHSLERDLTAALARAERAEALVAEYKTECGCPLCRIATTRIAELEKLVNEKK